MRALWAVAVLTLVAMTGCLGDRAEHQPDREGDQTPSAVGTTFNAGSEPGNVPGSCDPLRPAMVHGPDGAPATSVGPPGIPCISFSSWRGYEPSLGVTSDGALFVYPAWEDGFGNDGISDRLTGMGVARTLDGETWTRHLSTIGPVNYHPFTADPFMYVDPYTDRIFIEDLIEPPFNCSNLSFSDDGGASWTQTLGGCLVWDHVSYAAGPPIMSTTQGYPTVLQRCAITYVLTTLASEATGCQKSLDGGMTWQPPGEPAFLFGPDGVPYVPSTCNGAAHHVFVDHRGWTWLGRDWCGTGPWVAISKDEGATWVQHQVSTVAIDWHDVGVGADSGGTAYAFWISSQGRPLLAVSHDDGLTWTEPWDIGPPGLLAAGHPSLRPGGAGKAAISYAANLEADGGEGVHAIVVAAFGLDGDSPTFHTAIANPPDAPIASGACGGTCPSQTDFLTVTLGPEGAPYGSFIRSTGQRVGAGWLHGGPSLWDADDPNGPYADGPA